MLKSKDITLLTKFNVVKALVFSVVTYGCENWRIKKAECWRINAFELRWRRLLRVPWTSWKSIQSILRKINPEYSLEGLILKLQYFGHLMETVDTGKDPDVGRDWRQKEKKVAEEEMVGWHHQFNRNELGQTPGDGEGQGGLACYSSWDHKETWLSDWKNKLIFGIM